MISIKLPITLHVREIMKSVTISVILILLFTNLFAQKDETLFSHLTVEDGLSLNVVTQILQDDHGFMWFGTYNGLNRYDGYNFKTYLPEPSDSNSISSHSIWSIYEDSKGDIWIGTLDGLNKFNWKTETFTRYKYDPEDPHSISNSLVYTIFEDKSGTLWIGTLNGLNKYNREQDNFTVIKKVRIKQDDCG